MDEEVIVAFSREQIQKHQRLAASSDEERDCNESKQFLTEHHAVGKA